MPHANNLYENDIRSVSRCAFDSVISHLLRGGGNSSGHHQHHDNDSTHHDDDAGDDDYNQPRYRLLGVLGPGNGGRVPDKHRAEDAVVGKDSPSMFVGELVHGMFPFVVGKIRPDPVQLLRPHKTMPLALER